MKKNKKKMSKNNEERIEMSLPQNILAVGERVLEDKNIYIHQKVYNQIHRFAANKTENEHGGILVGTVVNELGKENTIINGFIEAKFNEATPTTLTFTHETWKHFHKEIDKKFKNQKIVGWIHTHPNFGIFLSENDKFIQQNFFTDKNQVAYVVDPIQKDEGFFFWIDEKLERCPGFYIFDKNGVNIKQRSKSTTYDDVNMEKNKRHGVWGGLAFILVIINFIFLLKLSGDIRTLELQNRELQIDISGLITVINNQVTLLQKKFPEDVRIINEEALNSSEIENVEQNGGQE